MNATILIVDDDAEVRKLLSELLEAEGYRVREVAGAAELQAALKGAQPDAVLLDWQLPDGDGLELLPLVRRQWPATEVIILTGHGTFDAAVEAIKRGAFHFQGKPFDFKALLLLVRRACEHKALGEEAGQLRRTVSELAGGAAPIFQSAAMRQVLRVVQRVAPSEAAILVVGESGTGKEVIADLLHAQSPRARGPMVKVNCAALPRELIESELFGSVKGAFTGAVADRDGLFRQAERGTLFLDEISEMPLDTQSKLLRVLQEKECRPVGAKTSFKTDCRVVAATNRPVDEAIREGKLREDLYYRISTITIAVPPLRERPEDILALANAFLQQFAYQAGRTIGGFSPHASELLQGFSWPGNVRQLQNTVQRAVLLSDGRMIEEGDLALIDAGRGRDTGSENELLLSAVEKSAILRALKASAGNKQVAARRLGIGRQTLYNKLREYGIET